MPAKTTQPDREGPAWEAFLDYWKRAIDAKQHMAVAWRAFEAAFNRGKRC